MHYENSKYKAEIDKVLAIQRETRSKLNSKLDLSKCIIDSPLKLESEKEVTDQETKPQIRVTSILTTNLNNIDTVISNSPNSLWIADYLNSVLAHVQITNTSIQILSKFKMDVYDMAVDANNNILLSVGGYDLKIFIKDNWLITCIKKLLNKSTWKICKFDYYLHIGLPSPRTSGIHVTSDRKLIIGAIKDGSAFIRRGQTIVTVNDMNDEERTCVKKYELDNNNLLLSLLGDTKLRMFNVKTGQGLDSRYNVASMWTWGINVTMDQKVIIGAASTPFVHECRREINCQEHDNQTCVFYCKTCEQLICIKCITKNHKGHDAVDEEEYKAELYKLKEMQKETESKLSKLSKVTKCIPGKTSTQKFRSGKNEMKEEKAEPNTKVSRQFTTGLHAVHTVISDSHDSVWIADRNNDVLNQLKVTKDNIHVKSKLDIKVLDMIVYSTNSLLLSVHKETRLKLLNVRTLHLSDSKYSTAPLLPHCLSISRDKNLS
ncbi:unnamed protein product [Mytilus edulis]|uniref:B box-type domain-containing protein n=1 Tax=Mytilus edulis TaxID=6550 RepID=A0A8S3T1V1_MYTED|nr:unnamed protein product [Mytilus edulis]